MARIQGIDPQKTSFLMRFVFRSVRKIFGKDLTPQKISARFPRVFWVNVINELLLNARQNPAALALDRAIAHGRVCRVPVLNRHRMFAGTRYDTGR